MLTKKEKNTRTKKKSPFGEFGDLNLANQFGENNRLNIYFFL